MNNWHRSCLRCGTAFETHINWKKYCSEECRELHKVPLTNREVEILHQFEIMLKKYNLGLRRVYRYAIMGHLEDYYKGLLKQIPQRKRAIYVERIRSFMADFNAGWWIPGRTWRQPMIRRKEPLKKQCPVHAVNCPGSAIPGNCPKNFKPDCFMAYCDTWDRVMDDYKTVEETSSKGKVGRPRRVGVIRWPSGRVKRVKREYEQ